jgi:hypothetical protein
VQIERGLFTFAGRRRRFGLRHEQLQLAGETVHRNHADLENLGHGFGVDRRGEEEALHFVAAHFGEDFRLPLGFDAFGHRLHAEGAREIRLVNRTHERAQKLAADLGGPVTVVRWEERADSLAGVATLVNATTQGSAGKPALDLSLDALPREAIVGDAIYVPPETPLLATARARGNRTMNGLGMLLNQARPAFEAWFGVMPSITPGLKRAIESTF